MNRTFSWVVAAFAAAAVEAGCLWVLAHKLRLDMAVAFALSFTAGYVALFLAARVLRAPAGGLAQGGMLRAFWVLSISTLVLVEVVQYLCANLLGFGLVVTNAVALVAVACWLIWGWRFQGIEGHGPDSGSVPAAPRR
jgi:hypothetical protein